MDDGVDHPWMFKLVSESLTGNKIHSIKVFPQRLLITTKEKNNSIRVKKTQQKPFKQVTKDNTSLGNKSLSCTS